MKNNHVSVKLNMRNLKIAAVRAAIWIAPFIIIAFVSSAYEFRMSGQGFIVPVLLGAWVSEAGREVSRLITDRLFRREEEV